MLFVHTKYYFSQPLPEHRDPHFPADGVYKQHEERIRPRSHKHPMKSWTWELFHLLPLWCSRCQAGIIIKKLASHKITSLNGSFTHQHQPLWCSRNACNQVRSVWYGIGASFAAATTLQKQHTKSAGSCFHWLQRPCRPNKDAKDHYLVEWMMHEWEEKRRLCVLQANEWVTFLFNGLFQWPLQCMWGNLEQHETGQL